MHRHCGTNNRAPRWTFTDPCKPGVRPGAREGSASPAWLTAPAMNARDTAKVYIWRLDTGCGPTLYRKFHSHNTPGKRHNNTWVEPLAGNCTTSSTRQRKQVWPNTTKTHKTGFNPKPTTFNPKHTTFLQQHHDHIPTQTNNTPTNTQSDTTPTQNEPQTTMDQPTTNSTQSDTPPTHNKPSTTMDQPTTTSTQSDTGNTQLCSKDYTRA